MSGSISLICLYSSTIGAWLFCFMRAVCWTLVYPGCWTALLPHSRNLFLAWLTADVMGLGTDASTWCRRVVEVVCNEGPKRVMELVELGAEFTRKENGALHLTREGGHSHRRIVHAADVTGREIERALLAAAAAKGNITFFEHHAAVDLVHTEVQASPGHICCCTAMQVYWLRGFAQALSIASIEGFP